MSHVPKLLFSLLALLCCGLSLCAADKPNIILIMADDLGYECISANGSTSYKTPHIDRIASEGVRFENAFANPLCTPSRVKIMTGLYNVRNYVRFGLLPRGETTFAHQVKKVGYTTCIAGKWQLGNQPDSPTHFGFDKSCLWQHTLKGNTRKLDNDKRADNRFSNPDMTIDGEVKHFRDGEFGPTICTDYICSFIEENKDKPFCVYYPMILTHCPFIPTPDSTDWDPKSPGSPTYKGDAKYFGDMVTTMDNLVGRIDAKLAELGLSDNTLFVFTGDNGTDAPVVSKMGEQTVKAGKGKVEDTGTRVPFVAKWPGKIKTGAVSRDLVDFADLMPTICEITKPDARTHRQRRARQRPCLLLVSRQNLGAQPRLRTSRRQQVRQGGVLQIRRPALRSGGTRHHRSRRRGQVRLRQAGWYRYRHGENAPRERSRTESEKAEAG